MVGKRSEIARALQAMGAGAAAWVLPGGPSPRAASLGGSGEPWGAGSWGWMCLSLEPEALPAKSAGHCLTHSVDNSPA